MWDTCIAGFPPVFRGMPMGILGIVLLIVLGLILFKLFSNKNVAPKNSARPTATDQEDSLHILKVRLAKGEIDVEEFNKLKSSL